MDKSWYKNNNIILLTFGTRHERCLILLFQRSCTLFLFGLALGSIWGPYLDDLRIFGVLQRFGICYWIVASLAVIAGKKRDEPEVSITLMFHVECYLCVTFKYDPRH